MAKPRRRRRRYEEEQEQQATSSVARLPPEAVRDEAAATDRLLSKAGPEPQRIAERLQVADPGTQTRALESLQRARGNSFVQRVVAAMSSGPLVTRRTTLTLSQAVGRGTALVDVQRAEDSGDETVAEEAEPLDTAEELALGASEVVGPAASSTYAVSAATLAEVYDQVSSQPEAGQVSWATNLRFAAPKGRINAVQVTAQISLIMPSWQPPTTMLPKARAEWQRWYAALAAHEQGHIDMVHANFDGLADQILGKTATTGKQLFENAKAKLSSDSKAFDKRTDHGRKTGTVMDVSIEETEIEEEERRKEEERKKKEAEKSASPEAAPAP